MTQAVQADMNKALRVAPYALRPHSDAVVITAGVRFSSERADGEFKAPDMQARLHQILFN